MTKDVRVIVVKLADRLHNMRTLGSMRPEKTPPHRQRNPRIYAQIANRIGLNNAYQELQDLSFQNLHPRRYETLKKSHGQQPQKSPAMLSAKCCVHSVSVWSVSILKPKSKAARKTYTAFIKKMLAKKLRLPK